MKKTCLYVIVLLINACQYKHLNAQIRVGQAIGRDFLEAIKKVASPAFPNSIQPSPFYLLDFWSTGCSSCMAAFPKLEGLQNEFLGEIKIVAVNPWQDDSKIDQYMSHSRIFRPTILPALNGDSSWRDLFPVSTIPHHVWLDSIGTVLAITGSYNTTSRNITALINGELPRLVLKPNINKFDLQQYSLEELFDKSAFNYNGEYMVAGPLYEGEGGQIDGYQKTGVTDSIVNTVRYSFINTTFYDLYKSAWALKHTPPLQHFNNGNLPDKIPEPHIVWEVSSPNYFIEPSDQHHYDAWSLRTKFCVEFVIPKEKNKHAADIIFKELNEYFFKVLGVSASLERRMRKCLIIKSHTLSVSRGGVESHEYDEKRNVRSLKNVSFSTVFEMFLLRFINKNSAYYGYDFKPTILLDETGITENVDMEIKETKGKKEELVELLNDILEYTGLVAEHAVRELEVLIITDQPPFASRQSTGY